MSVDLDNPPPECAQWARLLEAKCNEVNELRAELKRLRDTRHVELLGGDMLRDDYLEVVVERDRLAAELDRTRAVVADAERLYDNAAKCHDRPYMGCSMNHDTILSALDDSIDALRTHRGEP